MIKFAIVDRKKKINNTTLHVPNLSRYVSLEGKTELLLYSLTLTINIDKNTTFLFHITYR